MVKNNKVLKKGIMLSLVSLMIFSMFSVFLYKEVTSKIIFKIYVKGYKAQESEIQIEEETSIYDFLKSNFQNINFSSSGIECLASYCKNNETGSSWKVFLNKEYIDDLHTSLKNNDELILSYQ